MSKQAIFKTTTYGNGTQVTKSYGKKEVKLTGMLKPEPPTPNDSTKNYNSEEERERKRISNARQRIIETALSAPFTHFNTFTTENTSLSETPLELLDACQCYLKSLYPNGSWIIVLEPFDKEKETTCTRYHVHGLSDFKIDFKKWCNQYQGSPSKQYSEPLNTDPFLSIKYILKKFNMVKRELPLGKSPYRTHNVIRIPKQTQFGLVDENENETILYDNHKKDVSQIHFITEDSIILGINESKFDKDIQILTQSSSDTCYEEKSNKCSLMVGAVGFILRLCQAIKSLWTNRKEDK